VNDSERRWIPRSELDALCGERLGDATLDGLWAAGTLDGLRAPCVAVVGARAPSDDGRRRARRLAETLARNGVCVVSGLALGIDGAAHEGALAAGAPTIGVLGGGHAHFFPPRNRDLGTRIASSGGAVLSPFAPDVQPQRWQFLARNAVIAALSDAVVVVEAAARSGALNTAGHAADRGIPVLAFPGDVDRPKAAGCNALIRDGATLVRDADDVLAALPTYALRAEDMPAASVSTKSALRGASRLGSVRHADAGHASSVRDGDSATVRCVLDALAAAPRDAGLLADALGLSPAQLFPLLSELEVDGRIVCGAGGYALGR
jgi:DNA processing protein